MYKLFRNRCNMRQVIFEDIEYELNENTGTASVTRILKHRSEIQIPAFVDGYAVTIIRTAVFSNSNRLEIIKLPDTISFIMFAAFRNCLKLKRVIFYETDDPATNLYIDNDAFRDCKELQRIDTPVPIRINCSNCAFANCINLTHIGGFFRNIGGSVFLCCGKLEYLYFANEAIWKTTSFQYCPKLKTFTFEGNISKKLPKSCFKILKNKNIRCYAKSNLAELIYSGINIEIM